MTSEPDAVDRIVAQWRREVPELDLRPMELFGRVYRVSELTGARLQKIYMRHGIGRAEFDVLASLRRSGEPFTLSPKQIGSTLMLTSGGLTCRLDKLERAGLVERLPDPTDRRGVRVRLTKDGRKAVEAAVVAGLDAQDEILTALSPAERATLNRLLRKLHAAYADDELG
ncbi:MAG: MarR family winged helix-turn-helix transcriptional regulator [Stackebrandtia sp.]